MIWNLILRIQIRLEKSRRTYHLLYFYRNERQELAIIRLPGKPNGQDLSGPILTEKEFFPDISLLPKGLRHEGIKHGCSHQLKEVIKDHLRQLRKEHGETQTADIDDF